MGWRYEATKLLGELNCVCPLWHPEELTDAQQRLMVEKDMSDIDRCVAVLANCWKPSFGTPMEIRYAYERRMLVATVATGHISGWLKYHSDYVTNSVSDACWWLSRRLNLEGTAIT